MSKHTNENNPRPTNCSGDCNLFILYRVLSKSGLEREYCEEHLASKLLAHHKYDDRGGGLHIISIYHNDR